MVEFTEDTKREFDKLYNSCTCVWGLEADKYLAMFLDRAPRGHALDIGCGEGRHSLFLAQNGYTVDAVDISEKALEKLTYYAKEYDVNELIFPLSRDVRTMDFPQEKYDLVVISFVFPFLKRSDICTVIQKVKHSVKPKGCIYISALTTDDREYQNYSKEQQPTEPRTYYSKGLQCYCYFFEKNELKNLFSDFHIIDYTETVVELSREPYTHAMCLLFAQKVIP
ncbi:MAG: class I SAM-dependent methyltransferase [Theionarchaea archaeon]|nr:MAG: hypothetical protein AYK19_09880 [Theionarchaea archaeon DG-70-1]MBU7028141.1 class I SAM-dependent methyltransferase [Theionarchaea archaeon]